MLICAVALLSGAAAIYYFRVWPIELVLSAAQSAMNSAPSVTPRSATPVPVKVAASAVENVPIYLTGIGTIQAYNTVNVQSRVDGAITQVLFQEGQDVKQGDALAIIDPRPLQAQLDQQIAARQKDQALLDGAVVDMERYDGLIQKAVAVTRQVVDQQHALVDQYRAQVKNDDALIDYARTQLSYTTIRAPIDGRLGIRQVDQGNYLRAITPTTIVTITQLQPISVIFTLSAVAVGQTRLGLGQVNAPVVALGPDNTTELDRGAIILVDNQVDQTTGTIKLKASFPNLAFKLWPGNFVNGRITVDTRPNAVTVPSIAVRHGPRGDFVWVAKSDHTTAYRPVVVGQAFGGRSLIDRGLAKGEQVVTEGYYRLENGSRIEISEPTPKKAVPTAQAVSSEPDSN
jgi:multidrug efflux system membrane fusion protein